MAMGRVRTRARVVVGALAALLLSGAPPARAQFDEVIPSDLRNLTDGQPLQVEDALPVRPGLQPQLLVSSGTVRNETGLLVRPQVLLGTRFGLELGAAFSAGLLDGTFEARAIEAHLLGFLVRERGGLPGVALKVKGFSPDEGSGAAGQLGGIVTRSLGPARVHVNGAFRVVNAGSNAFQLGVAGDRPLNDDVLLVGGAYFERFLGPGITAAGLQAGANARLGQRFLLQGSLGINSYDGELTPRALLGVGGRL